MSYTIGLVSVVIPTYKRSEMLKRAIDSVLEQSYNKVECIVVNDNTPGDEFSQILYKLIEEYKNDNRFRFIEQEVHKNGAAARNVGIRASKGEYIAFLDDDDFWDKNKVEIQVGFLKKLPDEWGAVGCLMKFHKNNKVVAANHPYRDGNVFYRVLTRCIGMGTGALLIRRSALDETGYFDENLRRFQDPQVFSCLTEKYKIKLIKCYLHNRDIDDAQNRPSIETINGLQDAFFISVSPLLKRLPKRKVKVLKTIYHFDKAKVYWRGGEKIQALIFVLEVFKYPETVYFAFKRLFDSFYNHIFVNRRLKKYSIDSL